MYIAIDIGGTNIRIASFDSGNNLLKKTSFVVEQDFELSIQKIISEINNNHIEEKIDAIGIAAPGDIDFKNGWIDNSANLPGWNKKPIKQVLKKEFNADIVLDNDVKAAALGEKHFGMGIKRKKFLFVIWGTGFAGALVRKIKGKNDVITVELGHQILEWGGLDCRCGQHGCAEVYIGGGYAEKTYEAEFSVQTKDNVWNKVSQRAGHALINGINFSPVNLIVFSGGVIVKQKHLLDKVKQVLNENLKSYPVPELSLSLLGEDVGLFGAYSLLLE